MSLFLIHLLRAPHKTELFLVSQRAEEVPALTQFIKVLMEDNYEASYSESDCRFSSSQLHPSTFSVFAN